MYRVLLYDPNRSISSSRVGDIEIYCKNELGEAQVFVKTCAPAAIAVSVSPDIEKREKPLKKLKSVSSAPIIAITDEKNAVFFYKEGADNVFYGKDPTLFACQVRASVRLREILSGKKETKTVEYGSLYVSLSEYRCRIGEKEIRLPKKELEILYLLASNIGTVFSRNEILDEVWGVDYEGDPRTVDVHIRRLRIKIGENGYYIKTVNRAGYAFCEK